MQEQIELTILMPCLDESETLATCVKKAKSFLETHHISGEIVVADNGSTDGSQKIAEENGARVVNISERGYGSALIGGTKAALGKYVIMGDADDSYDFVNLMPFVEKLRAGYELVMGNRFKGGIASGAMPPLHRYLGNPVLSGIGRLFYRSSIGDFHCGLRGYNREAMLRLDLQTTGMEYASEMVVKSTLYDLKITEVPTTLSKDGRSRPPYLRSWSDGWRHLRFLLVFSPNWLFLYPGAVLALLGIIFMVILTAGPLTIGKVSFDITTLIYAALAVIIGVELISFSIFAKLFGARVKLLPNNKRLEKFLNRFTLERGLLIGLALFLLGIIATIFALAFWAEHSFGDLNASQTMRIVVPAVTLVIIGVHLFFSSFYIYMLNLKHK